MVLLIFLTFECIRLLFDFALQLLCTFYEVDEKTVAISEG